METMLHWIWLTCIPKITSADITALLEHFDTVDDIYAEKEFAGIPGIKPSIKSSLKDKSLKAVQNILNKTQALGGEVLTFDDIRFPDQLRQIENPPYVLYVCGEIMKWDRLLTIGVVGTRECTDYGIAATRHICPELAENGVTIVSGMARGIDTAAAVTAMNSGGKTIAVLGCGLDVAYPAENADIMERIKRQGAVITEFPPGTEPKRQNFPQRNRIISGLSRGVLVVEAPAKSGSLITARLALEQGRDVFAVPGSIFHANSAGTNELIGSMARPVTCAKDILDDYSYHLSRMHRDKTNRGIVGKIFAKNSIKTVKPIDNEIKISLDDKKYAALSDDERAVITLLIDGNMHIDDIKRKCGFETSKLLQIMSMLEFSGHVRKIPGNNYKLNI